MKLPSHQLAAFYETAKARSFSKAAQALAVTQSALSQRVAGLEDFLETTLFVRDPAGLKLTHAGEMLLRYCQTQGSLEEEFLQKLIRPGPGFAGIVRIAGFSSVLRSVIIPALAPFLRKNPEVQFQFRSYEVIELPELLKNAEADFIVLDYRMNKSGIKEYLLGQEEYVVIESAQFDGPKDVYLDHGPHDNATESFFQAQPQPPKFYRRTFMGDVYGILNGVEQGLGRAVMSKHLIKGNKKIRAVGGFKKYFRQITLNHYEQPYYSALHREVAKILEQGCKEFL